MLFTNNWDLIDSKNISTNHIIALVFFIFVIVAIVSINIVFFIYRNHIKKIYDVDRRLTLLLNNPIDNKIKRVSNIANNIPEFEKTVADIKAVYVGLISTSLNELTKRYKDELQKRELYKITPMQFRIVRSFQDTLEEIEANIRWINIVIDEVIQNELLLRDYLIDFQQEWSRIESRYEQLDESTSTESKWLLPLDSFNNFINQKNNLLMNFDNQIKLGDYEAAKDNFELLTQLSEKFSKQVEMLPIVIKYFKKELPFEMDILRESSQTIESVAVLRRELDRKIELVNESINSGNFQQVIELINEINASIETFKKERKLENAFLSFINQNREDLLSFLNDITKFLEVLQGEDSKEYNNNLDKIDELIRTPIKNIKTVLKNENKRVLKKNYSKYLMSQRNDLEQNLWNLNSGIKLLKSIKTNSGKMEQDYVQWISGSYEAKSLLISCENILNQQNGLSEQRKEKYKQQVADLWSDLYKEEIKDYQTYGAVYPQLSMRKKALDRMNSILKKTTQLNQEMSEAYKYYSLAYSIVNYYQDIDDFGYELIWKELIKYYVPGSYKRFVKKFLEERKKMN